MSCTHELLDEGVDEEEEVHGGEGHADGGVEAETDGGERDQGEEENEEEDEPELGVRWHHAVVAVLKFSLHGRKKIHVYNAYQIWRRKKKNTPLF